MLTDVLFTGKEFKMYRCAMGLTLQEVADELLVTKQTLSMFETGSHNVSNASVQYYTIGILILWGRYKFTDEEIAWRLECGKAEVNVGNKRNAKVVEYIKKQMANKKES